MEVRPFLTAMASPDAPGGPRCQGHVLCYYQSSSSTVTYLVKRVNFGQLRYNKQQLR
jgi:hypothetical protein